MTSMAKGRRTIPAGGIYAQENTALSHLCLDGGWWMGGKRRHYVSRRPDSTAQLCSQGLSTTALARLGRAS